MSKFYMIGHNTSGTKGSPWVSPIVKGLERLPDCPECGHLRWGPVGPVQVNLHPAKGTKWTDALGCGDYPIFIIAQRVLDAWRDEGIGEFRAHSVEFVGPLPKRLQGLPPPAYRYLDGKNMQGALMDLDASGYVVKKICGTCGDRDYDIEATHIKQHSTHVSPVIFEDTWNGANIFTTDQSPTAFYCTEVVVDSIARNKFTNFDATMPCLTSRRG